MTAVWVILALWLVASPFVGVFVGKAMALGLNGTDMPGEHGANAAIDDADYAFMGDTYRGLPGSALQRAQTVPFPDRSEWGQE